MEKVLTARCLARLKTELAGLSYCCGKILRLPATKSRRSTRFSNLHASVEVGTLYLQPRDTFAFVLGDAVFAQAG